MSPRSATASCPHWSNCFNCWLDGIRRLAVSSNECSMCSEHAEVSIVVIASSLGVVPRLQSCSKALRLCKGCLRGQQCQDGGQTAMKLVGVCKQAQAALTERLLNTEASQSE